MKVINSGHFRFRRVISVFKQLSATDAKEDSCFWKVFVKFTANEIALLELGAMLTSSVDGLLVFIELVEGKSQSALAGSCIVPVLQEGLPTAGDEGYLLRSICRVLHDFGAFHHQSVLQLGRNIA